MIYGDVTINFPIANIYEDTVQLSLNINWSSGTDSQTYTSDELYLKIKTLGNTSLQYDLDNPLITPADYRLELYDIKDTLADYLFGVDFNQMTVTAEIKINGTTEFKGTLIEDSLEFDESSKIMLLVFSSNTNKINEVTLYNEDNEALNPFGYDLTGYNGVTNNDEVLYTIEEILTDILKLVDENIQLTISHDWLIGGITPTNRSHIFSSLRVDPKEWFTKPTWERNLGDLLKSIAKAFFSQIIVMSNSKAVLRKLYYYSSSNLQTVIVLKKSRSYKYPKIKYVNSKNTFGTLDGNIIYHFPNEGAYTEVTEDFVSYNHYWAAYYVYKATFNGFEFAYYAKDSLYSNYYNLNDIVARLMYYYRSKTYFNRVDRFKLKGINYNYAKNFNYNSEKYQILSMNKNLAEGFTEVEALYLGAITTEQAQ